MHVRALALIALITTDAQAAKTTAQLVEQGRHLVRIASCNDCHTAGFAPSGGKVPEKDWLTGDLVGFKGPWGTSYPSNLRKLVSGLDEKGFLVFMRNRKFLPPMPTDAIAAMTDEEIRSIFHFIKSLGDGGAASPSSLPPGEKPKTPFIHFVPQMAGK